MAQTSWIPFSPNSILLRKLVLRESLLMVHVRVLNLQKCKTNNAII
jgi:hypothetical protein